MGWGERPGLPCMMMLHACMPRHLSLSLSPSSSQEFMADVKARGKKQIYILKPDAGCQGRGIRLVQVRAWAARERGMGGV